ncbi:MAG: DUF2851 family protein [Bacteroidaceae bacterium]|nr:DUF2851 family protein [Bacteroidaceae bacterium]
MEKLLHYVWKHKILPLKSLLTTDGREIEILDPGTYNTNQGPDFFNAKVKIGETLWAGNIELHLKASDWFRHGHDSDPSYNNTILHIAQVVDCEVTTEDGNHPPQLQLDIPAHLYQNYQELCQTDDYPRCHKIIPSIPQMKAHMWMDALLAERMKERAQKVQDRVNRLNGDWEQATFVTLCRNFGFGLNGDTFERWAMMIPLQGIGKHRDNLFQIEAIFLGMAGLIDDAAQVKGQEMAERWKREFGFLSHKFQLSEPMKASDWKFLRTRPKNFPHVRILQIAELYHSGKAQMSALTEAKDVKEMHRILGIGGTSAKSRNLLIINTIVPLLYAYGTHRSDEKLIQKAIVLLEELPAEDNYILRQWKACGLGVETAADSQALIQLKREYCDRKDCLRCRFAYEFLKMD